jgi:hypothetical protein
MAQRLADKPRLRKASVFHDRRMAETSVGALLRRDATKIGDWLASDLAFIPLEGHFDVEVGRVLTRGATSHIAGYGVRVILYRCEELLTGYRIETAMVI